MNINSYLSYNPIGQQVPTSTNIVPVSQPQKKSYNETDSQMAISGELVARHPHTKVTIEQWQHSRIHVETTNPIKDKAISQYLLTQYATQREDIRQNIGIDTYA